MQPHAIVWKADRLDAQVALAREETRLRDPVNAERPALTKRAFALADAALGD